VEGREGGDNTEGGGRSGGEEKGREKRRRGEGKGACVMLPLFHEQAHSVSMIRHSMDVIKTSVMKLNHGQVPVITFDQPLYTLAKLVQWNWPESYGESKFAKMFGSLHVEMAALKSLGLNGRI
jgi:hypothetical protein